MANNLPNNSRRHFIKLTAIGLTAIPFATMLFNDAAADPISETDPLAVAMKYKADATQAVDRKDLTSTCANCAFYTSKAGDTTGLCSIFQGKLVSANGWCTAWARRS
jgi:hypothetical protein